MPILDDLLTHSVIGPAILQGRQQGLQEGREQGREEGARTILHAQIEKRFGATPAWVEEHLRHLTTAELDQLAIRLLDAPTLEVLFSAPK